MEVEVKHLVVEVDEEKVEKLHLLELQKKDVGVKRQLVQIDLKGQIEKCWSQRERVVLDQELRVLEVVDVRLRHQPGPKRPRQEVVKNVNLKCLRMVSNLLVKAGNR
jgi:hypothetical protein